MFESKCFCWFARTWGFFGITPLESYSVACNKRCVAENHQSTHFRCAFDIVAQYWNHVQRISIPAQRAHHFRVKLPLVLADNTINPDWNITHILNLKCLKIMVSPKRLLVQIHSMADTSTAFQSEKLLLQTGDAARLTLEPYAYKAYSLPIVLLPLCKTTSCHIFKHSKRNCNSSVCVFSHIESTLLMASIAKFLRNHSWKIVQ